MISQLCEDIDQRRALKRGGAPVSSIQPSVFERLEKLEGEVARLTELSRRFTFAPTSTRRDQVNQIKVLVSTRIGVAVAVIEGDSKCAHHVWARHVALYLIRVVLKFTLTETGELFRGKGRTMDHGTVHNAVRCVINRMQTELPARLLVNGLVEELQKQPTQ